MPSDAIRSEAADRNVLKFIVVLLLLRFALPLVTLQSTWELHRDEFLYFAMGEHLDFFRMQFPPMIAVIARTGRALFGDTVWAARIPAACAGAALTAVVLLLVRRLGGGYRAILYAWLALMAAPIFVRPSVLMHPVIFDQLWAAVALGALILAAHERDPRWWLIVGLGLGLGALTKFSVAFVGVSILLTAVLIPDLRVQLGSRWPYCALGIASVLAIPSLSGQVIHQWPFLAQMSALRATQLDHVGAGDFLTGQLTLLSAALIPAVAAGVAAIRGGSRDRTPAIAALVMLLLMLALHGKDYYAAPVYPVLLGIGALQLDSWSRSSRMIAAAVPTLLTFGALLLWPMGVPAFAPETMHRYVQAIGLGSVVTTNRGDVPTLPQDYADMLGWRALADSVGAIAARLPADARSDLTVIGVNYGRTGALAFHHARVGLPYPVSVASDFWAWGPGRASGRHSLIVADARVESRLRELYRSVTLAGTVDNLQGVAEEQHVLIFYGENPRASLASIWPSLGPSWN